jgi:hypothetical protein
MNKNKLHKIMIETECINYLKNIICDDFEIVRLFDGCKADIAIKPKNISSNINEWIGIQIKSTEKKVKNNNSQAYKFDLSKDYENYIIICMCLEDKNSWVFENELVSHIKSVLTIGNNSKYNKYKTENNIVSILENYYKNNLVKKFLFNELDIPQSKNTKTEYEYRKKREEMISFLNFINNEMEGLVYDFKIGNKKIQEKVGGHPHKNTDTYHFSLSKMNGRVNGKKKRQTYEIGDCDFYWLNCKNASNFYVVPENILIEKGYLGNADGKIKSLTISKTNKLTFWTKDYLFNYENLNKEKLCEILLYP